jgi:WD40 repeat protein
LISGYQNLERGMSKFTPPADLENTPPVPLATRTFGEACFRTNGDVAALAFTHDGSLWSIDETGVLVLWSASGQVKKRTFLSDVETLWAFAPNPDLLASGNDDLILWDTREGQLLHRLAQPAWVTAIAFSPDGTLLASGHDDGSVRFWNPQSGRLTGELPAQDEAISALAFSPNGEWLATACEDRTIRIWNALTHHLGQTLSSHTDRIPSLAWSADGGLLVSAGWDTSARVWKPSEQPDPAILLNSHADQVLICQFAPQGTMLVTADSEHELYVWTQPTTGRSRHVLRGHGDEIRALAFNADGTRLASAGNDRVIYIWDPANGQLVAGPMPQYRNQIAITAGLLPRLFSVAEHTFRTWARDSGDELPSLTTEPVSCLATSSNDRWLAIAGTGHTTKLYDLSTPDAPPRVLEATKPPIGALAFSPDGGLLAQSSPTDGLVWIWNTTTAEPDLILIEAADGCTLETIAVHPDGVHVAAGGVDYLSTGERDGAVCVWSTRTKEKSHIYDTGVTALAFDPQGRFLAGGGLDYALRIWDLAQDAEIFKLEGHSDRITALGFTPDASYLLSTGDDGQVRVWDLLSGRLIVVREFDSPIHSLTFSPDGAILYTGHANSTCSQYDWQKFLEE